MLIASRLLMWNYFSGTLLDDLVGLGFFIIIIFPHLLFVQLPNLGICLNVLTSCILSFKKCGLMEEILLT